MRIHFGFDFIVETIDNLLADPILENHSSGLIGLTVRRKLPVYNRLRSHRSLIYVFNDENKPANRHRIPSADTIAKY